MTDKRTPKYKIGDKVRLNVGGPKMAVKSLGMDRVKSLDMDRKDKTFNGMYECQWFGGKKLDHGLFPEESLDAVKEDDVDDVTPRH